MGNQCKDAICRDDDHEGSNILQPISQVYSLALKCQPTQNNFPQQIIPQTVKQKIKILDINAEIDDSKQLWKYQTDKDLIAYIITDKIKIKPEDQNKKQQKLVLNPQKYQKVLVCFFTLEEQAEVKFVNKFKQFADEPLKQERQQPNGKPVQKQLVLNQVYYGPINKSMKTNNAIIIFRNGQNYKGPINNFVFQGEHGIMRNPIGTHTYQGNWQNGKPHGKGKQFVRDKFQFEGQFQQGRWNGKGSLTLLSDRNKEYCYTGQFVNGLLEGPGQIHLHQALIYKGDFKNGKQHGVGIWTSETGESYQGQFNEGKKQGLGQYYFSSQVSYKGQFKNGKPNGLGQLIERNKITKGQWYNGKNVLVNSVRQL